MDIDTAISVGNVFACAFWLFMLIGFDQFLLRFMDYFLTTMLGYLIR